MHMPAKLRRLVIRRSNEQCEYCRLAQAGQEATFQIDHVIPIASGGQTVVNNLALACVSCSLRKGARLRAVDPQTGHEAFLYNPRRELWSEHFEWQGVRLIGLTATRTHDD
jgi:5-methylcytosine-specific restriction endonuclease McrA